MLPHYSSYAREVAKARGAAASLSDFNVTLKEDRRLTEFRNKARAELQSLYDIVRVRFDLPAIPVYLPVRKKITVRGKAHALSGMPREIRVYPIHGPAAKPYVYWQPCDILIDPAECVLETLIHECAHILEAHRNGVMGHEQGFVSAYCEIEAWLIAAGVCQAVDPTYRFSGCPPGSYAATQFGRQA